MASVRKVAWPTLIVATMVLAAWRISCILAGPDVDTDAYAHHMIARAILAHPSDLSVHWVWLPLFHYLQVPLVEFGGTMNTVRGLNVVLSAAVPLMLFGYVRRTSSSASIAPEVTALLAALFAAACPIAMQMGTTAQPEPLFALVMLAIAIAFEERRYAVAAGLLGFAVMLRYEAWAALAAVVAVLTFDQLAVLAGWRRHRQPPLRAWAVVIVPALLIGGWAILRRPVDGRWFGFLQETREFATNATHEQSALAGGLVGVLRDVLYYPVVVPARVLGPILPMVALGVPRTIRQQGARFVLVLVACLGFVSLTWVTRSSLGLDRHLVVVVPLYATFAAQGVCVLSDSLGRLFRRVPFFVKHPSTFGQAAAGLLATLMLAALVLELDIWMAFWKGSIERGWPDRAALGAYLRTVPSDMPIFCDDATLEILSGLDRRRFDRHWVDDPHTWDLIAETARDKGGAYVATWARKLRGHETMGRVVFRAGQQPPDGPESGVAVMQVAAGDVHAAR